MVRLIDEDFRSFSPGIFPRDYSATGEYHFSPPNGYTGIWREPNRDTAWGNRFAFTVRVLDGKHYMEQSIDNDALPWGSTTCPLLTAGDDCWADYVLTAEVRPLSARYWAGIVFRYKTSRRYYLFALDGGTTARLYQKDGERLDALAACDFPHDVDTTYTLSIYISGRTVECRIDGKAVLTYDQLTIETGKIGLSAWEPARFSSVSVDMPEAAFALFSEQSTHDHARRLNKQKKYPSMRLERVIDFQNFGAARSLRFGDLTGDGKIDLLVIQPEEVLSNADETAIGCITAIDLRGRVLWQIGKPCAAPQTASKDMPAQIYDIDGDGCNEVIYARDFQLIVADGKTGRTKYKTEAPYSVYTEKFTIARNVTFKRCQIDAIGIVFPDGKNKPACLLIKDRYNNLWLYDYQLRCKWHLSLNTGHFPISATLRGEDAILAGHSLITDGTIAWTLPDMECHTDEIVVWQDRIHMASGEDGFVVADPNGKILFQDKIGHAQRISMGNFRPDLPGLETCVTTYWRNPSIITLYDHAYNKLFEKEHTADGNMITPVNWTGDGSDLLLYSASSGFGGLYDGCGDRVVPFPADDRHPELCCDAFDLTGDNRDELLAWDMQRLYVYTQSDSPKKNLLPAPVKPPHYNASNYRGEYAFRG